MGTVILMQDIVAEISTITIAVVWIKAMEWLAKKKILSTPVTRKWIHIGTGLIYMLCWPMFSDEPYARFLPAIVPGLFVVQFGLIGLGIIKDEKAVQSMSRTGNPRELLAGPLIYGIIHVVCTIVYWRTSIIGITSLILLCAGDGFADLLGRAYGRRRLPYNKSKTLVGSAAFFLSSVLVACIYIELFHSYLPQQQQQQQQLSRPSIPIVVVVIVQAAVACIVESLPFLELWDNLTVFISSLLVAHSFQALGFL